MTICRGPLGTYDSYHDHFNQESNSKLNNEDINLNKTIDLISLSQLNYDKENRRRNQNSLTNVIPFNYNINMTPNPM